MALVKLIGALILGIVAIVAVAIAFNRVEGAGAWRR